MHSPQRTRVRSLARVNTSYQIWNTMYALAPELNPSESSCKSHLDFPWRFIFCIVDFEFLDGLNDDNHALSFQIWNLHGWSEAARSKYVIPARVHESTNVLLFSRRTFEIPLSISLEFLLTVAGSFACHHYNVGKFHFISILRNNVKRFVKFQCIVECVEWVNCNEWIVYRVTEAYNYSIECFQKCEV